MDYYCPLVSVELYGHDSGIILYMINGSRAHLLIQFSLFILYSNQYRICIDSHVNVLHMPGQPLREQGRPSRPSRAKSSSGMVRILTGLDS